MTGLFMLILLEKPFKREVLDCYFDQLFTADCGLCDSDNVCGTCAGWIFDDDCGGCRFSFVCSVGVFFEKPYIRKEMPDLTSLFLL